VRSDAVFQWVEVEGEGEEQLMHALLQVLRDFSSVSSQSYPALPPPSPLQNLPPAVIFTPTRSSCERTASFLTSSGFPAVALHGGCSLQHTLQQQQLLRQRVISCIGDSFKLCSCLNNRACNFIFFSFPFPLPASCNGRHE
jgi:superfamily II DNA/RNA helicase